MNLETNPLPNGVTLIRVGGSLDLAGVNAVETRFYAHCGGEHARVLVDLSRCGFVASLGIRLLLQAIKAVTARGGRLLLLNPDPVVASALEISGLGRFIVRGTEAEAAAKVAQME